MCFYWVVGYVVFVIDKGMLGVDEFGIDVGVSGLEVVLGGQVIDEWFGIEIGQFFFIYGECNNWDVFGFDVGVCQFFVEWDVGVIVDG